ncbi:MULTISPECIES: DUF6481 family protein [Sphingomonadaceae]|jgi:hypothetical protein|uniref:DUF6481 family protein n=1 Tax=Sphingomonadales TaxID=204457 RepID=UPI000BE41382|nr:MULTISPECIES: DUF6481 family protein [Sphingomonadaceae]QPI73358.1 hypothetical protein IZV00_02310 [Sphingobium sp. Cam5-1]
MKRYKEPHFQERIAAAASARTEVLERLRTKVPVVRAVTLDQAERRLAKEAAAREKRQQALLAAKEQKAARRAQANEMAAAKAPNQKPELSEAERKSARDARYLARKKRLSS